MNRLLTNICSSDLTASTHFYTTQFDLSIEFDSDWFVHLKSATRDLEIGIISETHEIVPMQARGKISGIYLTFVVEDVDQHFQKAKKLNHEILQNPEATFYGQNRMILMAPEGTICDISSPTP